MFQILFHKRSANSFLFLKNRGVIWKIYRAKPIAIPLQKLFQDFPGSSRKSRGMDLIVDQKRFANVNVHMENPSGGGVAGDTSIGERLGSTFVQCRNKFLRFRWSRRSRSNLPIYPGERPSATSPVAVLRFRENFICRRVSNSSRTTVSRPPVSRGNGAEHWGGERERRRRGFPTFVVKSLSN